LILDRNYCAVTFAEHGGLPIFPLFGIVFMLVAIGAAVKGTTQAALCGAAKRLCRQQRESLLRDENRQNQQHREILRNLVFFVASRTIITTLLPGRLVVRSGGKLGIDRSTSVTEDVRLCRSACNTALPF
jgi:hypothetical protein